MVKTAGPAIITGLINSAGDFSVIEAVSTVPNIGVAVGVAVGAGVGVAVTISVSFWPLSVAALLLLSPL